MADDWVVTMPKLGETVTEGTVGSWLKNVGDDVAFDDPLFEVSTDKVDSEIPSPYDGVILEILVGSGETVPIGTVVVRIGPPGSTPGTSAPAASAAVAAPAAAPAAASGVLHDLTMPKLGETVTEGTVGSWLKNVGDTVAFDDPLYEVSTDKVDSEIPSPYDGVLLEILVGAGETAAVGAVVARRAGCGTCCRCGARSDSGGVRRGGSGGRCGTDRAERAGALAVGPPADRGARAGRGADRRDR
jgi:2-oxoglutarate dehydrogenase E2 component (dihydrolipoamide succinyltransferase)